MHPLRKCTCKIYGDVCVTYLHVAYECAHVTHLTYLGRTKTRRNTLFSFLSLSLFHELVYKRLCTARIDRSYQYLLRNSSSAVSLFLADKIFSSNRSRFLPRARVSRKICQDSLVVARPCELVCRSFLARKNYNKRFPPALLAIIYSRTRANLNSDNSTE